MSVLRPIPLLSLVLICVITSCGSLPSVPSPGGGGQMRDGKYVQSGVKYVPPTQFHNACARGNIFAVNKLLEDNPKLLNQHDDQYGESGLGWACRGRHYQVIRVLLDYEARTESRNYDGLTPLTIACSNEDGSLIMLLVTNGADVNYPDALGRTPLHWVAGAGNIRLVQYLIEYGAKLNPHDDEGYTPLDWAANNRHTGVAEFLRSIGAEPGEPVKKEEDETPADTSGEAAAAEEAPIAPADNGGN